MLGAVWFLHDACPVLYTHLVAEDSWGEYATFVSYMVAFVMVLGAMGRDRSLIRPGYVLMAAMLFVIGMEEISWGHWLLGVKTPRAIAHVNAQREINLHNSTNLPLMEILIGVIFVWITAVPFLRRKYPVVEAWSKAIGIPQVPLQVIPFFLLVFYFS